VVRLNCDRQSRRERRGAAAFARAGRRSPACLPVPAQPGGRPADL